MSGITLEGLDLVARIPAEQRLAAFHKSIDALSVADMLVLAAPPPLAGGAEIFPDEWLDHKLAQEPRNDAVTFPLPATMHMGLFRAGTTSSVPVRGTAIGSSPTTVVAAVNEIPTSGTTYLRVAMAAAVWGAQGAITTSGNGRRLTASQQSFAESGSAWATGTDTVKGFFLANAAANSAGKAIYYANFDDAQAIDINAAGYTVRVTPYYQLDG